MFFARGKRLIVPRFATQFKPRSKALVVSVLISLRRKNGICVICGTLKP